MNTLTDLMRTPNGGVVLCGRRGNNACCPVLDKNEDGTVSITDDFGGKVKMTIEQASLISQALDQISKD